MKKTIVMLGLFALLATSAVAQDLCAVAGPSEVLTTGKPYTVTLLEPPTVTAADGSVVPNLISGFFFKVDSGAEWDVPMTSVALTTATAPCATSSAFPNHTAYTYRAANGVSKGQHTLTVVPYVSDGTIKIRSTQPPLVVPFVAADLVAPPAGPVNGRIKR